MRKLAGSRKYKKKSTKKINLDKRRRFAGQIEENFVEE
jgi:hypothetical protein